MHPAWSIIFFTSGSGLGLGLAGWIVVGILDLSRFAHLIFVSGFTFGLIGAGLLSSTLHLGHPERAWRALSQWRSSWLSREGVLAVLVLAALSAWFLFVFLGMKPPLWASAALITLIVATVYAPSVFIIAYIFFGEIITLNVYIGTILILGGIIVSTYNSPKLISSYHLVSGVFYGALAQILTALSVLSVKPIMVDNPILYVALIRFGMGLFIGLVFLIFKSGLSDVIVTFRIGISNRFMLLGAFFGTYLSVILWLAGYKYTLSGKAAIYNQLSTVLISIMAVIFLKEKLTNKKKIGIVLSFFGALFVGLDS